MRVRSLFFSTLAFVFIGAGCSSAPTKPVSTFPNVTPIITTSTQPALPPIADPAANAAMLPNAATSTASYTLGQIVFANWKNGAVWYEGKIVDVSGKLYTVKFNAGDTESGVTEARMFAKSAGPASDAYKPGEIVIARQSNGSWYKGKVSKDNGAIVDVTLDDKSTAHAVREDVIPQTPHKTAATKPATGTSTTPTPAKTTDVFSARTRVLVNWQDGPRWWDAVLNIKQGDQYSITYNDDHSTELVPASAIANYPAPKTPRTAHVGDKIIARAQNGYWYNATVSSVNGDQINITFFDGYTQTISPTDFAQAGR